MKQRLKKIGKIFIWSAVSLTALLLLLFALIWSVLRFPTVQNQLLGYINPLLSKQFQTEVQIGKLDLGFLKTIKVKDFLLKDQQGDTLVYLGQLEVNVGILGLLRNEIFVNRIGLDELKIVIQPIDSLGTPNYAFLQDVFNSEEESLNDNGSSWSLGLDLLEINLLNLLMLQSESQLDLSCERFSIDFQDLNLDKQLVAIDHIKLEDWQLALIQFSSSFEEDIQENEASILIEESIAPWMNSFGWDLSFQEFRIGKGDFRQIAFQENTADTLEIFHEQVFLRNFLWKEESIQLDLDGLSLNTPLLDLGLVDFRAQIRGSSDRLEFEIRRIQSNIFSADGKGLIQLQYPFTDAWQHFIRLNFQDFALNIPQSTVKTYLSDSISLPFELPEELQAQFTFSFVSDTLILNHFGSKVPGLELGLSGELYKISNPDSLYFENLQIISTFNSQWVNGLAIEALPKQNSPLRLSIVNHGDLNHIRSVANFQGDQGKIGADLQFKNLITKPSVQAQISWRDFHLPIDSISLQWERLDLATSLDFSPSWDILNFQADLEWKDFGAGGFDLEKICLSSSGNIDIFQGHLQVSDTALISDFDFYWDGISESLAKWSLGGQFSHIDLQALGLRDQPVIIQSDISLEGKGIDPDSLWATLRLENSRIARPDDLIFNPFLQLSISPEENARLVLESRFMKLRVGSNLRISQIDQAAEDFIHYLQTGFYLEEENYFLFARLELQENPSFLESLIPDLEVPMPISGLLHLDKSQMLIKMELEVPKIRYGEIEISGLSTKTSPVLEVWHTQLQINEIQFQEKWKIQPLKWDSKLQSGALEYGLSFQIPAADFSFVNNADVKLSSDSIAMLFNNSYLRLADKTFSIATPHPLVWTDGKFLTDEFKIESGKESIGLRMLATDEDDTDLLLDVKNFSLENWLTLASDGLEDIKGVLNANIELRKIKELEKIAIQLALDDIRFEDFAIGKLQLQANKPQYSEEVIFDFDLKGKDNSLLGKGSYLLEESDRPFLLELDIEKISMEQWYVFVQDYLNYLRGTLKGNLAVSGDFSQPEIIGDLRFSGQNALALRQTGTALRLKDQVILFEKEIIRFPNLEFTDSLNNKATLSGSIRYANVSTPRFDLKFATPSFLFMNTTARQSPELYGTIRAGADINISGPLNLLEIKGKLDAKNGSRITFVSDTGAEEISQVPYIAFKSPIPVGNTAEEEEDLPEDTFAFSLDVQIGVSKDTQINIILDRESGDQIVASGDGDIRYQMRTNGDMNLQGTFTIDKGTYNLSFLDVVRKRFNIRKGSYLRWAGDPFSPSFNLTAEYEVDAGRVELAQGCNEDEVRKARLRLPTQVDMIITGDLQQPELKFDIRIPEQGARQAESCVIERLNTIKNNESELLKQVFGLLVLGRFVPDAGSGYVSQGQSMEGAVSQRLDNSISQVLSSQLSRLTEDYLGGVELSVNLDSNQPGNEDILAGRNLGVQISKNLFNERLKVSVGGVTDVNPASGQTASAGVVGEFEVLYRIDAAGNLQVRIFRMNDRNPFANVFNQEVTGASLNYQKSFDKLRGEVLKAENSSK